MKIALLHYWMTNFRGGERVLAELAGLYPEAEIFTHAYRAAAMEGRFAGHHIHETMIAELPFGRRYCQAYLPLMPLALRRLKLDDFDLIISSESGPAKGVRKAPGAKHICYCHTPMRYLYDLYDEYYRNASFGGKLAMKFFRRKLMEYDLKSAESVDLFVANSRFVRDRIKRVYGRDAEVIHPPVETAFFAAGHYAREDYYLFVGQLTSYKRPELAVEACRRLGRRLVVVGEGGMMKSLRRAAAPGTEFRGKLSGEALRSCYGRARALIFPGVEDFGIVPVEAMASGTPVIALGAGGALETVTDGETGLFFPEATTESLMAAMERFEKRSWEEALCRKRAEAFDAEVFRTKMRELVGRTMAGGAG